MEQQAIGSLVAEILKLGVSYSLLATMVWYFWRETVRLQKKLDQKEDFILQETKANMNVLVHSMQMMEKVEEFLKEHAKDNVSVKNGQATILKLLTDGKKPG
jgi:hypothetical protein